MYDTHPTNTNPVQSYWSNSRGAGNVQSKDVAIALSTPDVSKDVPPGNAFTDARTNVTLALNTNEHSHLT